jgi:hypothetical protein
MPSYRLLSTRQNPDGSLDTPSLDECLSAPDNQTAALRASRFPVHRFIDRSDFAWLVDEAGVVVWTSNAALPKAA